MTTNLTPSPTEPTSAATRALNAAGDVETARDVGAIDAAAAAASKKLGATRKSLVERLIYGPTPTNAELGSGALATRDAAARGERIVQAALACLAQGEAFTSDHKLSQALRTAVAQEKAYGFTVPKEYGGLGATYAELAVTEEELAANGLAPLAVEISGELTIGAGSLLAYGTDAQKRTFLPLIAEGHLIAFALTEVKVGVNAKKVRAYVEPDPQGGGFRLFADGDRNKFYATNATHGALAAVVARLGKEGKQIGLFVVQLPDRDQERTDGVDYEFRCTPTGVDPFGANFNSRLHFLNFPVPQQNQIQADGVEALFYSLRMGRCMLAAMSAGYQRMLAADAAHYARVRDGVGGHVIKHELPRLALGKMLGGALMSRSLSHLSLAQDAQGVDLAGLRDLTKSAAATSALESMVACERVLGGRTFHKHTRTNDARSNIHVFGVVEGEDDLILMGMVKDVTGPFTEQRLAALLGVIESVNQGPDGKPLPREQRILRIDAKTLLQHPGRCLQATGRLLAHKGFWSLVGWMAGNALFDLVRLPLRAVPASLRPRYGALPRPLRRYARWAEDRLRGLRWSYLAINGFFQLELTRAQLPLQRLGKVIEHLVAMLALCHHAAGQDASQQRVAALQCELLRIKVRGLRLATGLFELQRLRDRVAAVGQDLEKNECTLLAGVAPEPFVHPWEPAPKG